MLLYVLRNSGVYYCLLPTNTYLLIFVSLSWQQCPQNYYVSGISNRDEHVRGKKKKKGKLFCPCSKEKRKNLPSFLLGLNHAGIVGSIYFTISLRVSPRAGRTETRWEILLRCQLARGQISLKKVTSQGAHNQAAFQLPCCKSLTLPISRASATGHASGAQPLHTQGRDRAKTALGGTDSPFCPSQPCISGCLSSCMF